MSKNAIKNASSKEEGKKEEEATPYESMVRSLTNRGKNKRKVKLIENQLIQIAFGESDSEDDEDFMVGADDLNSDDSNVGEESGSSASEQEQEDEPDSDSDADVKTEEEVGNKIKLGDILSAFRNQPTSRDSPLSFDNESSQDATDIKIKKPLLICGICLESEDSERDEILECDNCGITVHEGCYGDIDVSEDDDKSESDAPTEPWFCESCKAGVTESPICELCPNIGGIYKQTDTSKWVHLICALYTPYVGFRDVPKLLTVVLEDVKSSMWGSNECMFCVDDNFSRTGVCINCDAGMCRSTFHVTCAQKNGFLSDIPDRSDDTDDEMSDNLYAHCKLHSVKIQMRKRKQSWLAFHSHVSKFNNNNDTIERDRIQTVLDTVKKGYNEFRRYIIPSKPPLVDYPRLLSSCPEACMMLAKKAEILGLLSQPGYNVEAAVTAGRILKHEANLSAEFVNYFFKREMKVKETEFTLKNAGPILSKLQKEQASLTRMSEECQEKLENVLKKKEELLNSCKSLHSSVCKLAGKNLKLPDALKPKKERESKAKIIESTKLLNTIVNRCATCKSTDDQHLLIKCDHCKSYYHLACVDPPLTRIPKRSGNYSWQCTECDSSDESESEINLDEEDDSLGMRRRKRTAKEPEKYTPEPKTNDSPFRETTKPKPNPDKEQGKRKSVNKNEETPSKIKKTKNEPTKEKLSASNKKIEKLKESKTRIRGKKPEKIKPPPEVFDDCCVCKKSGGKDNLVKCDECKKCYHFRKCLDPPFSKSPKSKFWGWICEDCDETDDEDKEVE